MTPDITKKMVRWQGLPGRVERGVGIYSVQFGYTVQFDNSKEFKKFPTFRSAEIEFYKLTRGNNDGRS